MCFGLCIHEETQMEANAWNEVTQMCNAGIPGCRTPIAMWDMGQAGECHSEQFGIPIGNNSFHYAVLQVLIIIPIILS